MKSCVLNPSGLLDLLFFASIGLTAINVRLIQLTIVPLYDLAGCFLIAFALSFIIKSLIHAKWIGAFEFLVYNFFILGNVLTFILLGLNFILASHAVEYTFHHVKYEDSTQKLSQRGEGNAKRVIYAHFDKSFSKRIIIEEPYSEKRTLDSIAIRCRNGGFNYPIIVTVFIPAKRV